MVTALEREIVLAERGQVTTSDCYPIKASLVIFDDLACLSPPPRLSPDRKKPRRLRRLWRVQKVQAGGNSLPARSS